MAGKARHTLNQEFETFCNEMKPIVVKTGWIIGMRRDYNFTQILTE
jgi:hypothetical protein